MANVKWNEYNRYVSPENTKVSYPAAINNVDDAYKKFLDLMQVETRIHANNRFFANKTKMGDLWVYCHDSKPMEYTPVPRPLSADLPPPRTGPLQWLYRNTIGRVRGRRGGRKTRKISSK
jgi:hypothetical protein